MYTSRIGESGRFLVLRNRWVTESGIVARNCGETLQSEFFNLGSKAIQLPGLRLSELIQVCPPQEGVVAGLRSQHFGGCMS